MVGQRPVLPIDELGTNASLMVTGSESGIGQMRWIIVTHLC